MGWTKIERPAIHTCDKPYLLTADVRLGKGDTIRCDCGKVWLCVEVEYGMSYDPLPTPQLRWRPL